MFSYFLAVFSMWLIFKFVTGLNQWWRMRVSVRAIPSLPDVHWFYGINHKVKNVDDIIQLCDKFIQIRPLKWLTSYFLFLHSIVIPVHPDTVRAIVSTPGVPKNLTFTGFYRLIKPFLGDSLLLSNGPKWERTRRLLTSAFHFDILKPYVKIFSDGTNIFVDNLKTLSKSKTSVDILPMVTHLTLHNVLVCTFSYNDETLQYLGDQHPYVAAFKRVKSIIVERYVKPYYLFDWIFNISPTGREFKQHCDYIHNFSEKIIRKRRQALANDKKLLKKRHLDFLDVLLTAEDSNGLKLTDDEIRNEAETFMAGGHDTTASAISWALHSLAKYPEYQQRVRKEVTEVLAGKQEIQPDDLSKLPFTTCVIKETLRMYSPVPAFERLLHEPITIEGVDLMKGQSIYLIPHLLHHNPAVWEDHWEFKPERFLPENIAGKDPYAFLPFSAGQRNCIGQHFSMNEIKVVLSKIVKHFEISLDLTKDAEPFPEIIMGAKDGIFLHFTDLETS